MTMATTGGMSEAIISSPPVADLCWIHLPNHRDNPSVNIPYRSFNSYGTIKRNVSRMASGVYTEKEKEINSQHRCTPETPDGRHGLLDFLDAANAAALHLDLERESPGPLLWIEEPNPSVTPDEKNQQQRNEKVKPHTVPMVES